MKNMNEVELRELIGRVVEKYIDLAVAKDEALPFAERECLEWYRYFSDIPEDVGAKIDDLKSKIEFHRKRYSREKPEPGRGKQRVIIIDPDTGEKEVEYRPIGISSIYDHSYEPTYKHVKFINSVLIEFLEIVFELREESNTNHQTEITFEMLFVSPEAMETALDLAKQSGMIDQEHRYLMKSRKYPIVAYWHFLKDRNPPVVNYHPGKKACEVIARHFGTTIGRNFWSENDKLQTEKSRHFYRNLVKLSGNAGKPGRPV